MSAALLERPTTRVSLAGRTESVEHVPGETVSYYLRALGATIQPDHVAVVGGLPATEDTIVPENAALTVAARPNNG